MIPEGDKGEKVLWGRGVVGGGGGEGELGE